MEIRGLSVTFQDKEGTRAARQVNLRLDKGEMAALVGESGSGKPYCAKPYYNCSGRRPAWKTVRFCTGAAIF